MSLYQRYFAALMRLADGAQERHYGERKERLFDSIAPGDRVVEIGPGTGVNLAHLPPGVRYVGVEPNPHMHAPLRRKADALAPRAPASAPTEGKKYSPGWKYSWGAPRAPARGR
ncbi:MAG: hypothetical protein BRD52_04405 [Bacteroidetes bacterium SW_4_67_19]|nr:MAG: hypothetical protein BRD52_04405 [Bacteroidetes bacterium SW_4_67_19]